MTRPPITAGINQTPYSSACAGGKKANAPSVALQTRPHAQKMTPKATAITEATTMSMVRQRLVVLSMLCSQFSKSNQEKTHAASGGTGLRRGWRSTELPALALPRSGSRVCGRARTLSAVRSPVGCEVVSLTLTPT